MKIVIIAPSDNNVTRTFLNNYKFEELPAGFSGAPFIGTLIEQLLIKGHDVTAITTTVAINRDYSIKEFKNGCFKWVIVPARRRSLQFNGLKVGRVLDAYAFERRRLRESVLKAQPDFIHAHWSYEFPASILNLSIPYLITIHDNPYQVFKYVTDVHRFMRLILSEWVLFKSRYVSTVSPYMEKYALKRCDNVKIIPNPTKVKFSLDEISTAIRLKLQSLSSPTIIMVMNGWDKRKNGNTGLNIFKSLLEVLPNATLLLVGNGTEVDGDGNKYADSIGLNNVKYYGAIEHSELLKILNESHLLLHPALEESFGVVLIEAMSLGVPVIGGDTSGAVPWVLDNSDLLVDLSDVNLIKDKVVKLLTDIELYEGTAQRCYRNVKDRFSAEAVIDRYITYYEEIISNW